MTPVLKTLLIAIAISPTFISCNHETEDPIVEEEYRAGVYDDSFVYQEYSPALEIILTWDVANHYAVGKDSLDLNGDGEIDIVFDLSIINSDSLPEIGYPNPFPFFRIKLKDGYSIAVQGESYPIGLGQSETVYFGKNLNYFDRIDNVTEWRDNGTSNTNLWAENPGGNWTPSYGTWYYTETSRYIGIKGSGTSYGWIEIDTTNPYTPQIKRHAFKN